MAHYILFNQLEQYMLTHKNSTTYLPQPRLPLPVPLPVLTPLPVLPLPVLPLPVLPLPVLPLPVPVLTPVLLPLPVPTLAPEKDCLQPEKKKVKRNPPTALSLSFLSASALPSLPSLPSLSALPSLPSLSALPSSSLQTPRFKDKLFWCFYIVCEGQIQYELVGPNGFSVEKDFKIKTAERLKDIKDTLKGLKLRKSELESELVSDDTIGLKALYALCLLHNTAVVCVIGRKYIDIRPPVPALAPAEPLKKGIIVLNDRGEYALRNDNDGVFLQDIYANYWRMDSIGKAGLKCCAAYTLADLNEICRRLLIPVQTPEGKSKTKPRMYQEILAKIE